MEPIPPYVNPQPYLRQPDELYPDANLPTTFPMVCWEYPFNHHQELPTLPPDQELILEPDLTLFPPHPNQTGLFPNYFEGYPTNNQYCQPTTNFNLPNLTMFIPGFNEGTELIQQFINQNAQVYDSSTTNSGGNSPPPLIDNQSNNLNLNLNLNLNSNFNSNINSNSNLNFNLVYTNPEIISPPPPSGKSPKSPKPPNKSRDPSYKPKTPHVIIEKKYRSSLLTGIENLRNEISEPSRNGNRGPGLFQDRQPPSRLSKASVLRKAAEYIQDLRRKNELLNQQNEQLKATLANLTRENLPIQPRDIQPSPMMFNSRSTQYFMVGMVIFSFYAIPRYYQLGLTSNEIQPGRTLSMSTLRLPSLGLLSFIYLIYKLNQYFTMWSNPGMNQKRTDSQVDLDYELSLVDEMGVVKLRVIFKSLFYYLLSTAKLLFYSKEAKIDYAANFNPNSPNYTRVSLQLFLNLKDKWLSRFFRRILLLILNARYYQLTEDKAMVQQIVISCSMLLLSLLPGHRTISKFAHQLLNYAGVSWQSPVIRSDHFLTWLIHLPYHYHHFFSADSPNLNLLSWLSNQYYLNELDVQAAGYIADPTRPPSLTPLLTLILKDPHINSGSPCLLSVLHLETVMALTCHPHYALNLTLCLIQHYFRHPDYHQSVDRHFLRGLVGCALSLASPYQCPATANFFITNFLSSRVAIRTSFQFLITHTVLLHGIHLLLSPSPQPPPLYPLPCRYHVTEPARRAKLIHMASLLQSKLDQLPHPEVEFKSSTRARWSRYYDTIKRSLDNSH